MSRVQVFPCTLLVVLLATALTAQASFDFVGNLYIQITGTTTPVFRNYSNPLIVIEGIENVTISVSVYKINSTGSTYGPYKNGSCFIHYGSVLSQVNNATLTNVTTIRMSFSGFGGTNGTNDVYTTQLSLAVGKYQATAYCVDDVTNTTTYASSAWGNLAFNFEVAPTSPPTPPPTFLQVQTLYDNSYNCSGKVLSRSITNSTSCTPSCQLKAGPTSAVYLATDCVPSDTVPSIPEGTWVKMLAYANSSCTGLYEEVWFAANNCMDFPGGSYILTCNSTAVFAYNCLGQVQYCCSYPINACTFFLARNNLLSCEVVAGTSPTTTPPSLAPTSSSTASPTTSTPTTTPTSTSTKAPSAASHNHMSVLSSTVLVAAALVAFHLF